MKPAIFVTSLSIVSLATLSCFAMAKGIDGKLFAFSLALIAGLGGFQFALIKDQLKDLFK